MFHSKPSQATGLSSGRLLGLGSACGETNAVSTDFSCLIINDEFRNWLLKKA